MILRISSLLMLGLLAGPGWPRFLVAAETPGGKVRVTANVENRPAEVHSPLGLFWRSNYAGAMAVAEQRGEMLLIYFQDPKGNQRCERFEAQTLSDPKVVAGLQSFVTVKVPLAAKITSGGEELVLLEHPSFAEMLGRPGVAMVDFCQPDSSRYGHVVSEFPLPKEGCYSVEQVLVMLGLPPGSLTQRTLIYAVRVHPDRPASTDGTLDPDLVSEAELHSAHQARIGLQGHHQWDMRFRRINAKLPSGLLACEVCAESWPGQNLLEAAIECVRCWRFSPGHWSAVRVEHPVWGYDMKRGRNGIWYATGIFGRPR